MAWIITVPSTVIVGFLAFKSTQLPGAFAWIVTGALVLEAAVLIGWAMAHTITAEDVEAEIPTEEELEKPLELTPHLEGHGPAA